MCTQNNEILVEFIGELFVYPVQMIAISVLTWPSVEIEKHVRKYFVPCADFELQIF